MATIYQVSELAGVSLATVSRVMNNNARVSDKTKQKVLDAMDQLGYRPNAIAQSLASNRSNSVGLLVSELHGPFFGSMMSGIEAKLREFNKHAIITSGHSNEAQEKAGIEFLIARKCDALILHVEAVSDEYLHELAEGQIPFVLLNRVVAGLEERCINLDNEMGGYLAAKHLLDLGHRQFAVVMGPSWKKDATDRVKGHKRALMEAGLEIDDALCVEGDFQQPSGVKGLNQLLKANKPFTALLCGNDEMASGAMSAARESGLSVPEDLSIIGFDDVVYAAYLYPQLSTIDHRVLDIGEMAAAMVLHQAYELGDGVVRNLFEPKLVERNSVAKPNLALPKLWQE